MNARSRYLEAYLRETAERPLSRVSPGAGLGYAIAREAAFRVFSSVYKWEGVRLRRHVRRLRRWRMERQVRKIMAAWPGRWESVE